MRRLTFKPRTCTIIVSRTSSKLHRNLQPEESEMKWAISTVTMAIAVMGFSCGFAHAEGHGGGHGGGTGGGLGHSGGQSGGHGGSMSPGIGSRSGSHGEHRSIGGNATHAGPRRQAASSRNSRENHSNRGNMNHKTEIRG